MNETMSLLLATAILAAGGIGLFMLKSDNDKDYNDEENIILEEIEDLDDLDYDEEDDYNYKPKSKKNKTKKNNKQTGGSRRRY